MQVFEIIYRFAANTVESWGYWGLIFGMFLESACMPVPSEIVLPFGGYLVSREVLSFWPAALAGTLGGVLGSSFAYGVGAYGGRPFLERYGRYVFIAPEDLLRADHLFEKYGTKIVFWARLMPVIRTFISLPAGIARMGFGRFLAYTIAGSLPWSVLFTYFGVKLGENWAQVRAVFEEFDLFIVGGVVALVLFWIFQKIRRGQAFRT